MNKEPKIGVLMPIAPFSPYIEESLVSLLRQDYPHWLLIALLDSNDTRNLSLIKEIIPEKKQSLHFFAKPFNISNRLNEALGEIKTEFVARMDPDDVLMSNRLSVQVRYLLDNPEIALVGSAANVINSESKHIYKINVNSDLKEIRKKLLHKNQFLNPSLAWNRKYLQDYKFDEELYSAHDYGFILDVSSKHTLANLPICLISYRIHSSNNSKKKIPVSEIRIICMKKYRYGKYMEKSLLEILFWVVLWASKNIFISPVGLLKFKISLKNFAQQNIFKRIHARILVFLSCR